MKQYLTLGISLIILALFTLAFIKCTPVPPPSTSIETGQETTAPPGWIDYCHRHPDDPACEGVDR
jgi:predicted transglutaminase-like cysteine proteinase